FGADGEKVASGWVWAQAEAGGSQFPGVNAQIEDGHFELTGLPPGKYRVTVGTGDGKQKTVSLEAGKEARVDFAAGGKLRVSVRTEGKPASGAMVWANGEQGSGNGQTDEYGVAELSGLGEGSYTVQAHMGEDDAALHASQENVAVRAGA